MAVKLRESTSDPCDPELATAIEIMGKMDAELVAEFLRSFGTDALYQRSIAIPKATLILLGILVRVRRWEGQGILVHREFGFDLATLRKALHATDNFDRAIELLICLLGLFAQRFAWSGQAVLGGDVLLDVSDEDTVLDSMAIYFWNRRRH